MCIVLKKTFKIKPRQYVATFWRILLIIVFYSKFPDFLMMWLFLSVMKYGEVSWLCVVKFLSKEQPNTAVEAPPLSNSVVSP